MWQPSRLDQGLIFVALVSAAICFFLLIRVTPALESEKAQNEVGEVVFFARDVKRKFSDSLIWQGIAEKDKVGVGDSVFTGDQSLAILKMKDGESLLIEPDSIVAFERVANLDRIDVQSGSFIIELSRDKGLAIRNSNQTLNFISGPSSRTKIKVERTVKGELKVAPTLGEVKVQVQEANTPLEVNSSEQLVIRNDAAVKETSVVQILSPERGGMLWIKSNESVRLAWTDKSTSGSYRIRIFSGRRSSIPLLDRTVTGNSLEVVVPADDKISWTVAQEENLSAPSEGYFFTTLVTTPRLIFPPENYQVTANDGIDLFWERESRIDGYRLQVAKDSEFQTLMLDKISQDESQTIKIGDRPKVYWRVCYEASGPLAGLCSEPRVIIVTSGHVSEIQPATEPVPQSAAVSEPKAPTLPPKLPVKVRMPQKPKVEREEISAAPTTAMTDSLQINWEAPRESKTYHLQISRSKDFAKPVVDEITNGPTYVWKQPLVGLFYVRADGLNEAGESTGFSSPFELQVLASAPTSLACPNEVQSVQSADQLSTQMNLDLTWSAIPGAQKYLIEVSDSVSFDQARQEIANKPQVTLKGTPASTFYFRVQGLDEKGKPFSHFSKPLKVQPKKFMQQ